MKSDEIKYLPTDKDTIDPHTRVIINNYFSPVNDYVQNFICPISIGLCVFLLINQNVKNRFEQLFDKNTIYVQTILIMFISLVLIKYFS